MFKMNRKLMEMDNRGEKVRVALVGAGKMGRGLISQMSRIRGMRPSIVINRKTDIAKEALLKAGVRATDIVVTEDLNRAKRAIDMNKFVASSDYTLSYRLDAIQGVVDATGNPPFGAKLAVETMEHFKHMIMLNVECDAVVGPILNDIAKRKGVVYTGSAGDEPGAIIELANFALGIGFKLLAVGKGKNNPLDNYATPETLKARAEKQGLKPHMLTSFVDGTNTMIELTSVANALGFTPDIMGCHAIETNIQEIAKKYSLIEQGGILRNYNIVDYAFGVAPGVFAIVTHESGEITDLMRYLSMGDGPNYVLYRPFHLTSLETPITIYDAIVEHEPTIYPQYGQVSDTITVAKRDLSKGQTLEGIGGFDVFGKITSHKYQKSNNLLPIALITEKTRILKDVKKDELITMDMVQLDENHIITKLRRQQERLGL